MNQRGRDNRTRRPNYSGSNMLFTFGLISVVFLLIIGFVMTQGGMNTIAEKGKNLLTITLNPTPVPTAISSRATHPAESSVEKIKTEYEEKIRQLQDASQKQDKESQKREKELRDQYLRQIDDLKIKIQILEDENKRLRGGK